MQEHGLPVEMFKLIQLFAPIDANTAGAAATPWINMREWDHCTLLLAHGAAANASPVVFNQAQDNLGTGAKALNGINTPVGGGVGSFQVPFVYAGQAPVASTTNNLTSANLVPVPPLVPLNDRLIRMAQVPANPYTFNVGTLTTGGATAADVYNIMEINASDLDVTNGFDHFGAVITAAAGASICSAVALLTRGRHPEGWVGTAANLRGGPRTALD